MKLKITLIVVLISVFSWSQITEIYDTPWQNIYVNGKFIFQKFDPVHGTEIWASDGTTAGTNILFDIVPGAGSSNPNYLTVIDDVVYFQATSTNEIWRTDGTSGGTYTMISSGLNDPRDFTKVGSFILFRSGVNNDRKLWKMQATPNSHEQLSTATMVDVSSFHRLNSSNVLFNVKVSGTNHWEIWRTNGSTLSFVADIDAGNANIQQIGESILFNGELYFSGYSTANGYELWKTDGSTSGTTLVADIQSNVLGSTNCANCASPSNFEVVGSTLFFEAGNPLYGPQGRQLYKSSGTGATIVKIINPNNNALIEHCTSYNGKLYFVANDGENLKIWESDGTETGTFQLTNNPLGETLYSFGSILNKIPILSNHIFYNKITNANGYEVWKLNLSNGENSMVQDYNVGTSGFLTFDYFVFNDELYFSGQIEGQGNNKMYKLGQEALSTFDFEESNSIQFYPNPTSDVVNLIMENNFDYKVEVYNLSGQLLPVRIENKQLDFSALSQGTYLLKINNKQNNKATTLKIVKQ